jgi:UDP-GlcNAc:undecaprenyl-phosphate GlcNAc-1-phosphate transferase
VGFLVLNWRPAKLYMGDTGSQFLGALLAYVGIVYFWNLVPNSGDPTIFSRQVIFALLAFLMPILDTTFVTVARLSRGQSPAVGGRDHTTHHLAYLGIPQGLIPLIYISITLLSGLLINSILRVLDGWSHFHTLLYGGFVLGVFGLFVFLYRKGGADQREREAKALAATESASLPKTPQPAASEKAQVAVQR